MISRFLAAGALALAPAASAQLFIFTDPSGLSAEVEFTLLDPTTLEVRARNTSTATPDPGNPAVQILTGISWDFDPPGLSGSTAIAGGTIVIGPTSQSVNFDTGSYGPGTNVGGEWGYSNVNGTGLLPNFISGNAAHATPFGGPNLDGPVSLDGPQGGLVANPLPGPLGGLGAIQDEIIATLTLTNPIANTDFLAANTVRVEFGSDDYFITVPEPGTLVPMALLALLARRRR